MPPINKRFNRDQSIYNNCVKICYITKILYGVKLISSLFRLRAALINVEFRQNNRTLYVATSFAGFTGIFNGMKPNKFSLSLNSRLSGGWKNVFHWLTGDPNYQFATYATRCKTI